MNTNIKIRQLGDVILHTRPQPVNFAEDARRLEADLQIMFTQMHVGGGVGMAANQCAEIESPRQMLIIGTHDPRARDLAQQRYPDQVIPEPIVMINPEITQYSGPTYFPRNGEGCLSVFSAMRGKLSRYSEVTVRYQDQQQHAHEMRFSGFAAHIVQHEYEHLCGVVYLQKIFAELDSDQLQRLLNETRKVQAEVDFSIQQLIPGILVFGRDEVGKITIDYSQYRKILRNISVSLWQGILAELEQCLSHK